MSIVDPSDARGARRFLQAGIAAALFGRVNADCGYAYAEKTFTNGLNCTAVDRCLPGEIFLETPCGEAECLPPCDPDENTTWPSTTQEIPDCGVAVVTCAFGREGEVEFVVDCSQGGSVELPACGGVVDCTPHVCTPAPTDRPTHVPSFAPTDAPSTVPTRSATRRPTAAPTEHELTEGEKFWIGMGSVVVGGSVVAAVFHFGSKAWESAMTWAQDRAQQRAQGRLQDVEMQ